MCCNNYALKVFAEFSLFPLPKVYFSIYNASLHFCFVSDLKTFFLSIFVNIVDKYSLITAHIHPQFSLVVEPIKNTYIPILSCVKVKA